LSKVAAYNLLRWENAATFAQNCAKVALDFPSCRGRIERGAGIGRTCIEAFAPKGAFTQAEITGALESLKQSGRMAKIIVDAYARVKAELKAEQEAAARELAEAKRRAAAARTKRERVTAERRAREAARRAQEKDAAAEGARKAVDASAEKQKITYDARCNQVFRLDSHADTFRGIVIGETFQQYLPVAKQFAFAKALVNAILEQKPDDERDIKLITASDIRNACWSQISISTGLTLKDLETGEQSPFKDRIRQGMNLLRRASSDYKKGVEELLSAYALDEPPDDNQLQTLEKYIEIFLEGIKELQPLRRKQPTLKLVKQEGA